MDVEAAVVAVVGNDVALGVGLSMALTGADIVTHDTAESLVASDHPVAVVVISVGTTVDGLAVADQLGLDVPFVVIGDEAATPPPNVDVFVRPINRAEVVARLWDRIGVEPPAGNETVERDGLFGWLRRRGSSDAPTERDDVESEPAAGEPDAVTEAAGDVTDDAAGSPVAATEADEEETFDREDDADDEEQETAAPTAASVDDDANRTPEPPAETVGARQTEEETPEPEAATGDVETVVPAGGVQEASEHEEPRDEPGVPDEEAAQEETSESPAPPDAVEKTPDLADPATTTASAGPEAPLDEQDGTPGDLSEIPEPLPAVPVADDAPEADAVDGHLFDEETAVDASEPFAAGAPSGSAATSDDMAVVLGLEGLALDAAFRRLADRINSSVLVLWEEDADGHLEVVLHLGLGPLEQRAWVPRDHVLGQLARGRAAATVDGSLAWLNGSRAVAALRADHRAFGQVAGVGDGSLAVPVVGPHGRPAVLIASGDVDVDTFQDAVVAEGWDPTPVRRGGTAHDLAAASR